MVLLAKLWKALAECELCLITPWESGVVEAPSFVLTVPRVYFLSDMA